MSYLLRSQVNPVCQLLVVWISLLGRGKNFRDVVNWPLNLVGFALFLMLHSEHSANNLARGRDVQEQRLLAAQSSKHRLGGDQSFEFLECSLLFIRSLEFV